MIWWSVTGIYIQTTVSNSGGIIFRGGPLFSLYNNLIWQADDCTACTVDRFLFHAEVIRTVGFRHVDFSVFNFTYIGIIDADHLILCKGVGAIFFTVYRDSDSPIVTASDKYMPARESGQKQRCR